MLQALQAYTTRVGCWVCVAVSTRIMWLEEDIVLDIRWQHHSTAR